MGKNNTHYPPSYVSTHSSDMIILRSRVTLLSLPQFFISVHDDAVGVGAHF